MSRDYQPFLDDIRRSCEKVLRYTAGLTLDESTKGSSGNKGIK